MFIKVKTMKMPHAAAISFGSNLKKALVGVGAIPYPNNRVAVRKEIINVTKSFPVMLIVTSHLESCFFFHIMTNV